MKLPSLYKFGAAAFGAALLISPAALAGDKAEPMGKLASADEKFINKAAQGGMVEVKLAELGQQKSTREDVKQFATMIGTDHTKANEDLMKVVSAKGITLPDKLDASHAGAIDKLAKLDGSQFDRDYIDDLIKDHKTDVSEFESAAKNVKDPDLKAFIDRTLPVLRMHLEHIQTVDKNGSKK